jgi:CubicO group peptidase (beta-lactamase class C family)
MTRLAAVRASLLAGLAVACTSTGGPSPGREGRTPPPPQAEVWPGPAWAAASPESVGMDPVRTADAIRYGSSRGGSGIVVRAGRRVGSWGDQAAKHDLKSTTKSFGSILLGLALGDGLVTLDTEVRPILPELGVPPAGNAATGWLPLITVRHLATHTAGFAKKGGFEPLRFEPGTAWLYSDGGPNWLADLLTVRYGRDLATVFRSRVLTPMGIGHDQLVWRRNRYRPPRLRGIERREFGSGIWTSVDVMARLGLMLLRDGRWGTTQILPTSYPDLAGAHQGWLSSLPCVDEQRCPGPNRHYGLLFWNNADGAMPGVPRDAYRAAGLHTSFILVIPSLDLVVARAGPGWRGRNVVSTFFAKVAAAADGGTTVRFPHGGA